MIVALAGVFAAAAAAAPIQEIAIATLGMNLRLGVLI